MYRNFPTFGADPEVFMQSTTDGKFVNAWDKVPGDKWAPHRVDNGAVQVDGVALEFNIDPCVNEQQFLYRLENVSNTLSDMIGDDYAFLKSTSVKFDEGWCREQNPDSLILGCMPDWNAWTGHTNKSPDSNTMMRTAGGHIHVGFYDTDDEFSEEHMTRCATLAKIMDEEVGAYSVLWDEDDDRRKLYGLAGSFRPKKYGMEYRTLSNAWIFDRKLAKFCYRGAERAVNRLKQDDLDVPDYIEEIINESLRDHEFFDEHKDRVGAIT